MFVVSFLPIFFVLFVIQLTFYNIPFGVMLVNIPSSLTVKSYSRVETVKYIAQSNRTTVLPVYMQLVLKGRVIAD